MLFNSPALESVKEFSIEEKAKPIENNEPKIEKQLVKPDTYDAAT